MTQRGMCGWDGTDIFLSIAIDFLKKQQLNFRLKEQINAAVHQDLQAEETSANASHIGLGS